MRGKILIAALPIPGICDATEAASQLARTIRANDRSTANSDLIQLPLVDGGKGTIDFLVTHSLGSFLEVEAKDARGADIVVPIGFAGEDGKLAVIEMSRVASVPNRGDRGTTVGIGELIQDALDEGAFSILLGQEEPVACDAGFGAAAALGVRFFDANDIELDFHNPGADLSTIARVDASARSFSLLSSRIFIAQSESVNFTAIPSASTQHAALFEELPRIAEIIRRDTGIHPVITGLSASAIEFGLITFLGAEVRDGAALVLEASGIDTAIAHGDFSECIVLTPSVVALDHSSFSALFELVREKVNRRALLVTGEDITDGHGERNASDRDREQCFYLKDIPLFHAPVDERSSVEEKRRDFTMRLEKIIPIALEAIRGKHASKESVSKGSRA